MKHYRSSIPKTARERVVATFIRNPTKYMAEYVLHGKVVGIVGIRFFHETGDIAYECPLKDGVKHGIEYRSDVPGKLLSAEPYSAGLPHGVAKQWSDDGRLIGTYTMNRGTGLDLWRCGHGGCSYVTEARYLKDGKWHGFEWWLNPDQKSVWNERHFRENQLHGIERSWNAKGVLRRGYPKYWIEGERVTKRQYVSECSKDPFLPPFQQADDRPQRKFPPEVIVRGD